jgi:hypothetical protein
MPQQLPSSSFPTDQHSPVSHCIASVTEKVSLNIIRERRTLNNFLGPLCARHSYSYVFYASYHIVHPIRWCYWLHLMEHQAACIWPHRRLRRPWNDELYDLSLCVPHSGKRPPHTLTAEAAVLCCIVTRVEVDVQWMRQGIRTAWIWSLYIVSTKCSYETGY